MIIQAPSHGSSRDSPHTPSSHGQGRTDHQPKPPALPYVRRDVAWRYIPPLFFQFKINEPHTPRGAAPCARSIGALRYVCGELRPLWRLEIRGGAAVLAGGRSSGTEEATAFDRETCRPAPALAHVLRSAIVLSFFASAVVCVRALYLNNFKYQIIIDYQQHTTSVVHTPRPFSSTPPIAYKAANRGQTPLFSPSRCVRDDRRAHLLLLRIADRYVSGCREWGARPCGISNSGRLRDSDVGGGAVL